ncbi:DNA-methyltransferase [Geosporobacter ferrireducens]|uniref:DNA-methyltransferase n=1 Tax=Geosporobacter ferrireducens TaxID=1424294 RepID=UPI00147173CE|nr:site-specific DNA-methyltransferase [Geosporobacter ferrireducens]
MKNEKKIHLNRLYKVLNIKERSDLRNVAKKLKLKVDQLEYYNDNMIFPDGHVLDRILEVTGYTELELKIRLGMLDNEIIRWIADNPEIILNKYTLPINTLGELPIPNFTTQYGELYQADSIELMKAMQENSIDMIFADPPFNLSKTYGSGIDDNLSEEEYLAWTEKWISECVRILKPGGALFVYNIPKWLTYTSNILNKYLLFRHWISINFRAVTPPIANKLNVNHYGVLYYIKGEKPNVFNTQRIPMKTCRHCGGEIHDYGGKKRDVNVNGQTISDIWEDIHPVRHKGHKNREENELPIKLLFRIVSLATNEGDIVFDPFGGSGTTYIAAELLNRRWIGSEIGSPDPIVTRFNNMTRDREKLQVFLDESDKIFTDEQRDLRVTNGFWLPEDFEQN